MPRTVLSSHLTEGTIAIVDYELGTMHEYVPYGDNSYLAIYREWNGEWWKGDGYDEIYSRELVEELVLDAEDYAAECKNGECVVLKNIKN